MVVVGVVVVGAVVVEVVLVTTGTVVGATMLVVLVAIGGSDPTPGPADFGVDDEALAHPPRMVIAATSTARPSGCLTPA